MKFHELIKDMPSEIYHGTENIFSSSQFKDILKDEELFYRKYITKELPREDSEAFGIGTVFHTGVLEPHLLEKEIAVYPGRVRKGSLWDSFQKTHKGKCIVTASQFKSSERLIELVRGSKRAMRYIDKGSAEVSFAAILYVYEGSIASAKYGVVLTANGWVPCDHAWLKKAKALGVRVNVKVRADSLGKSFVLDLKSTTGNAKSQSEMENKVKYYNYDLSAALYLDMFSLARMRQLTKFIWTFASKDQLNVKTWFATEQNILVGRAKWSYGLTKIAACIEKGWKFTDDVGELDAHPEELYWLRKVSYGNRQTKIL